MSTEQTSYQRQITQEAAQWFVAMQSQRVTRSERERFARWLSQSARHVQEYLAVAAAWRMSADAAGAALSTADLIESARVEPAGCSVIPLRVDRARLPISGESEHVARREPRWKVLRAVAFVCGAVIALAWLWSSHGVAEYRAGPGDQVTAVLADGSRVKLNTRTHIRARLSAHSRDVELLEGEALFKVAKDAHRPFRVFVKGSEIRAVGTEFNVYRQRDVTTVTVLEGRVEVMHAPEGARAESLVARLSPRQQVAVAQDGAVLRTRTVDVSRVTAWTQARLRFSGETLGEVVEQFNRYNTSHMVLEDPSLAEVRVSGVFSPTDVDSFIAYLKHTEHVTTEESGGVIHLVREARSSTGVPEQPHTVPDSA